MSTHTDETPRRPRLAGLTRRSATAITALGLLGGGIAGGYIVTQAATSGSSSSATPSSTAAPGTGGPSNGVFKPNEDPTHETGESAAREAQENGGQRPTVP